MTISISPELKRWIFDHRTEDPAALALECSKKTGLDFKKGIEQIRSYQKAKGKIPEWAGVEDIIWPPPLSIEQCSSEYTAQFKSAEIRGSVGIDLTGGAGVDCYYLSRSFDHMVYVEPDPRLCALAQHNFRLLGARNIRVVQVRAEDFVRSLEENVDLVYIDPSRRREVGTTFPGKGANLARQKVFRIEDSSPQVLEMMPDLHSIANQILIKFSPLLDLSMIASKIGNIRKIYVVAVDQECKELLIRLEQGTAGMRIEAVHIRTRSGEVDRTCFSPEEEQAAQARYALPGRFLYEPNAALLKAGAFNYICRKFGVLKLHPNTHLYTSDEHLAFPGNVYHIHACVPYSRKSFEKIGTGNTFAIKTRNFPDSVTQLKRKLNVSEGHGDFLYGTTLATGRPAVLHCTAAASQPAQYDPDTSQ